MKWTVSPSVVWTSSSGEVRLYDTTSGEFQTLNPTAAAIWRHLVEVGDQDAIVAALATEFGAEDDHQRRIIATDADTFLRDLADRGLIAVGVEGQC
jgi:PqqD family protein of HPr-rel-A system